jgi:GTP-binding protein
LVDGTLDDVVGAYCTIREELAQYGHGLAEKLEIVGLNKSDALDPATVRAKCRELQQVVRPGTQVHPLSGVTGAGAPEVVAAVLAAVSAERAGKDKAAVEASSLVHAL